MKHIWRVMLVVLDAHDAIVAIVVLMLIVDAICLFLSNMPPSKARSRISKVWNYFTKSPDAQIARCNSCRREYKTSGNTSNLMDHVRRAHKHLMELEVDVDMVDIDSCSSSNSASGSSSVVPSPSPHSISSYFTRTNEYERGSTRKKNLDRALAIMVSTDFQPFTVVEDAGFKNFVKCLDPRWIFNDKWYLMI